MVKVSGSGGCQRLCFWLEADGQKSSGDTDDACAGVANLALGS